MRSQSNMPSLSDSFDEQYALSKPSDAAADQLGVRFNPGLGSGGTGKTNVGGPSSSFGIWHELMPQVKELITKYDLKPV